MPVEMPKGLPFAVDTWSSECDAKGKRYHFLTHAHRDHLVGIESRASYPIYATRVTISIVRSYYPQLDEDIFVEIKVGQTLVINDADGDISVTVCDANHCPVGFQGLYQRARETLRNAQTNREPTPLFIRPSTQWYASKARAQTPSLTESEQDEFGVWHVCFSIHSSREELELALQLLQPKWVISTTPPSLAMELSYVKKHCFTTRWNPDDPLWRVFKFSFKKILDSDSGKNVMVPLPVSEVPAEVLEHGEMELVARPITLFGRARFGMLDELALIDEDKSEYISHGPCNLESDIECHTGELRIIEKSTEELHVDEEKNKKRRQNCEERGMVQVDDGESDEGESIENVQKEGKDLGLDKRRSFIASSSDLTESLRQLYRSRNVPVPRPLPSLVELMETSKRAKIGDKPSK